MNGRLFAVVGPSGAGKDTLIEAARPALPDLVLVRRVITRPETAGGERFEGVSEAEFERRRASGAFALDWEAHGLRYGIPADTLARRAEGRDVLFNGSRAALERAAARFPELTVIRIVVPPEVLTERLVRRGRETRDQIAARVSRSPDPLPAGLRVIDVANDGSVAEGAGRLVAALTAESLTR